MTKPEAIKTLIGIWDTVESDRCASAAKRKAHRQELVEVLAALGVQPSDIYIERPADT